MSSGSKIVTSVKGIITCSSPTRDDELFLGNLNSRPSDTNRKHDLVGVFIDSDSEPG